MTDVGQAPSQVGPERSRSRRSELERLIDRTILGPTHPQLGTCWQFTGTTTPYGRIAKAQDSYTHRLGWKLLRGPIPAGQGVASPLRRLCLLEPGPSGTGHARRESGVQAQDTLQTRASAGSTRGRGRESAGRAFGRTSGGFGPRRAAGRPAI
jgi:hypothetical protein